MRKLIRDLHEQLNNVEADLNYDEAILDGSWPQAVEILERALEKAKARQVAA